MNPTRRDFLIGTAATSTLLYLALPAAAEAATPQVPTFVDRHGLPPTSTLRQVVCRECGETFGSMFVDELDKAPVVVCQRCYEDVEDELEEAQDRADARAEVDDADDDRMDLERELDEMESKLRTLEPLVSAYQQTSADARWLAYDLADADMPPEFKRRAATLFEMLDSYVHDIPKAQLSLGS